MLHWVKGATATLLHLRYENRDLNSRDVYAGAERLTRRLGKSRSQIYTEAMREYLARHDPDTITDAINQVSSAVDMRPGPFLSAAARHQLERVEW